MHKVKVFIPAIIWRQEWAPDGAFYPGGLLHIMTYMGRLLAKGVAFLFFRYTKELEISLAEVYERVGKCVISVSKKAQKD